MADIHNPSKDWKPPTLPLGNVGVVFSWLLPIFFSGGDGISRRPWENWGNGQVLRKLAVKFIVQCLCNGTVQGLSEALARIVCEAGPSQVAALKLFWMQNSEETTTEAL